jgi:hypothetical protein
MQEIRAVASLGSKNLLAGMAADKSSEDDL